MLIKLYFNNYNIGYKNIKKMLNSYGLLINKKYDSIDKNLYESIKKSIILTIIKKEVLFKSIYENLLNKVKNGSYIGYKRFRGLPMKNQRTKTNSRTSRKY